MAILAKTVSVPNSQINVEEFLNIENYKAGNFSIFPNDNSLINGWRMFIMFFKEKHQVVHQIWRHLHVYP